MYIHNEDASFIGEARILNFLIDSRIDYLTEGINKGLTGENNDKAILSLKQAHNHRVLAAEYITETGKISASIANNKNQDNGEPLQQMLQHLLAIVGKSFLTLFISRRPGVT
jgi:hypothetical protein